MRISVTCRAPSRVVRRRLFASFQTTGRAERCAEDTTLDVTGVARLRGMARETSSRTRLRLHRVARNELASVDEGPLDCFRSPSFDGEVLRRVVASVAVRLGMAGLTEHL